MEAMTLLDAALKEEEISEDGGDRRSDDFTRKNLTSEKPPLAPRGFETRNNLRRLRKNKPELHERVITGDLTPHAAMQEAGFLPKRRNVNMYDPESAAGTIAKHMDRDKIAELITL